MYDMYEIQDLEYRLSCLMREIADAISAAKHFKDLDYRSKSDYWVKQAFKLHIEYEKTEALYNRMKEENND